MIYTNNGFFSTIFLRHICLCNCCKLNIKLIYKNNSCFFNAIFLSLLFCCLLWKDKPALEVWTIPCCFIFSSLFCHCLVLKTSCQEFKDYELYPILINIAIKKYLPILLIFLYKNECKIWFILCIYQKPSKKLCDRCFFITFWCQEKKKNINLH